MKPMMFLGKKITTETIIREYSGNGGSSYTSGHEYYYVGKRQFYDLEAARLFIVKERHPKAKLIQKKINMLWKLERALSKQAKKINKKIEDLYGALDTLARK